MRGVLGKCQAERQRKEGGHFGMRHFIEREEAKVFRICGCDLAVDAHNPVPLGPGIGRSPGSRHGVIFRRCKDVSRTGSSVHRRQPEPMRQLGAIRSFSRKPQAEWG